MRAFCIQKKGREKYVYVHEKVNNDKNDLNQRKSAREKKYLIFVVVVVCESANRKREEE